MNNIANDRDGMTNHEIIDKATRKLGLKISKYFMSDELVKKPRHKIMWYCKFRRFYWRGYSSYLLLVE